jgi:hypothetical protein
MTAGNFVFSRIVAIAATMVGVASPAIAATPHSRSERCRFGSQGGFENFGLLGAGTVVCERQGTQASTSVDWSGSENISDGNPPAHIVP